METMYSKPTLSAGSGGGSLPGYASGYSPFAMKFTGDVTNIQRLPAPWRRASGPYKGGSGQLGGRSPRPGRMSDLSKALTAAEALFRQLQGGGPWAKQGGPTDANNQGYNMAGWSLVCDVVPPTLEDKRKVGAWFGVDICNVSALSTANGPVGMTIPAGTTGFQLVSSGVAWPNANGRPFREWTRAAGGPAVVPSSGVTMPLPWPSWLPDQVDDRPFVPVPDPWVRYSPKVDVDGRLVQKPSVRPSVDVTVSPVTRHVVGKPRWKPPVVTPGEHVDEPDKVPTTKRKVPRALWLKLYHLLTEGGDALDCVFKSIPKSKHYVEHGVGVTAQQKIAAIWANAGRIDLGKVALCVGLNEVEDYVVGYSFGKLGSTVTGGPYGGPNTTQLSQYMRNLR